MKIRKLFPAANISINSSECYGPYGSCDPYYYYYYPEPPPPSLPLPSPLAVPGEADKTHGLSASVIVLIALLAGFSLLVGYYIVVSKSCFCLCRRRRNDDDTNFSISDGGDEAELVDDNHQHQAVDHHVWFITTVGLPQAIINSITVVRYKKNEGLIEGTECSICLNEFREDERLRLLPKCSHAFHISCIETWLRSHTNCPLCRAHIVNDANPNRRLEPASNQNVGDNNTPSVGSETNGTGHRVDQDVNSNDNMNNSNASCVLERGNDNGEMMGSVQVRLVRSVSVDSSSSSSLMVKKTGDDESENQVYGRSSREDGHKQCLRISPILMKRSLSCGGRFLSSRTNSQQRLNSLLLPL